MSASTELAVSGDALWPAALPVPPLIALDSDRERTNRRLTKMIVRCDTPVEAAGEVARVLASFTTWIEGQQHWLARFKEESSKLEHLSRTMTELRPTEAEEMFSEAREVLLGATAQSDRLERLIRVAQRTRGVVEFVSDAVSRAAAVWSSLEPVSASAGWRFVRCLLRDADDPTVEPMRTLAEAVQRVANAPEAERAGMVDSEIIPALWRCAEHYGIAVRNAGSEEVVQPDDRSLVVAPAPALLDPALRPAVMVLAEMLIDDLIRFPPKE